MSPRISRAVPALAAGAAAFLLAGCVVAPAQPYYTTGPQPYYGTTSVQPYYGNGVVVASSAPPPLIVEPQVFAPAPGYLWIGGYWSWSSGRHVWTPGRWEAPRSGYRWVPRSWVPGHGGWQQHGGYWERH